MTSTAGSAGGPSVFRRFTSGFGPLATVVLVGGLLLAIAMIVVPPLLHQRGPGPEAAYLQMKPAAPVRISLANTDTVAPIVASAATPATGLLQPPTDAPLVTWWKASAKPGSSHGQTVLMGHSAGSAGALGHLADLKKADFVDLLTDQGTMRYRVLTVRTVTPEKYAQVSPDLYKQDGGAGRLVLISAQQWDGHAYQQDVLVTAAPLGEPT